MNKEQKNRPDHYDNEKGFDVIDFCKAYDLNFNLGNVVKYIARAGKKEGETKGSDLMKALDYLNREIDSHYLQDAKEKSERIMKQMEEDHSIQYVKKQHLIGFCINCDHHTDLVYFNDIDLFMCSECHDMQFRKEREEAFNKVNTCPADGYEEIVVDDFFKSNVTGFAPVEWNCDEDEEIKLGEDLGFNPEPVNKPEQNQQVSTCVETFTLEDVFKAVEHWSAFPVCHLSVLQFLEKNKSK